MNKKVNWRINEEIHAPKVRVLDENGEQLGILSVSQALEKAKEAKVDLVEVAPKAKPPVVKIVDFGKFRYREEKKLQKQKKGAKQGELKEIRFSPFIGEKDYETRLIRVREFLKDGNKVRLVVKFKGRQMGSKKFGYNLIERIFKEFEGQINIDMRPKFLGRHLAAVISPLSKSGGVKEKSAEPESKK